MASKNWLYPISAKVELFDFDNTLVDVKCKLVAGTDSDLSRHSLEGNTGVVVNDTTIPLELVHSFSSGGKIRLLCDAFGVNVGADNIKIVAVTAGILTKESI
jgi:hypothetical protein